ncbi:MAG TPA: tripartite tricarboxylate transporter substrate binding protein [Burkholderiales bacterium]|nr:tripartite tricarboxylate transporter substrate binding protein [Burkholderiales bacterium]
MKLKSMRALLALAALCTAAPGVAQNFPSKPIRFVVGLAPGGGTDIVARMVGQKLSQNVNQQVIVDNRPGASGNIAAELVARSAPDGYTLLVTTASHVINPALYKKLSYDPIKDFAPVTQLTAQPYIFVVHPTAPAKNVKEFIALARSRKDGLTYASSGAGLLGHLAMELLKSTAKFQATHVPYKGAAPALMATISGEVDAFFPTIISGTPQVKNGKLRAIAVTTTQRSPLLPNVPTVAEQGFPSYEVSGWYGLLAPAAVPKDVLAALNAETVKVLRDPEIKQRMSNEGAMPVGNTPEQFAKYMTSEAAKWAKVVKASGAKAD